jgi:hypothetical protein
MTLPSTANALPSKGFAATGTGHFVAQARGEDG